MRLKMGKTRLKNIQCIDTLLGVETANCGMKLIKVMSCLCKKL